MQSRILVFILCKHIFFVSTENKITHKISASPPIFFFSISIRQMERLSSKTQERNRLKPLLFPLDAEKRYSRLRFSFLKKYHLVLCEDTSVYIENWHDSAASGVQQLPRVSCFFPVLLFVPLVSAGTKCNNQIQPAKESSCRWARGTRAKNTTLYLTYCHYLLTKHLPVPPQDSKEASQPEAAVDEADYKQVLHLPL